MASSIRGSAMAELGGARPRRVARRWAAVIVLGAAAVVLLGPVILWPERLAPADPGDQTIAARLRPPGTTVAGMRYALGSDHLGRDVLSRIVFGGRISLVMGLTAVLVSAGVGATAGVLAGYLGGWAERAIMRLVDVQMAFPFILLAIVVATTALAYAIVAESSLSFLGVGIPASIPSWGGMLADGRQYVDTAWWLATF